MASLAAEAAFLALFTGKTAAKKVPLSFSHGWTPADFGGLCRAFTPWVPGRRHGWHLDSRLVGVRH